MAASLMKGDQAPKKPGENLAVTRAQSVTRVVKLVSECEKKLVEHETNFAKQQQKAEELEKDDQEDIAKTGKDLKEEGLVLFSACKTHIQAVISLLNERKSQIEAADSLDVVHAFNVECMDVGKTLNKLATKTWREFLVQFRKAEPKKASLTAR